MPSQPSPREVFDGLAARLAARPALTLGLDAAFQFDISGPQGGQWHLTAVHGRVEVGKGPVERPSVTFRMAEAVLADLATGHTSGNDAFKGRKVEVVGESTLEVYLGHFFGG